jgi:polynucleotide 5'-hydroxyl-kinase GRC3/NOL9
VVQYRLEIEMDIEGIDVPRAWAHLSVEHWRGTVMVVGAPDTGKSTVARYLCRRLAAAGVCAAYLDGDPGQSMLGPPATVGVALGAENDDPFERPTWSQRRFVGAVSPRGHMLPLVTSTARLAEAAWNAGAEVVVHDTCGLIDPHQGGTTLKLAQIALLRPSVLVALQRGSEMESFLVPLRKSRRTRVIDLTLSAAIERRSTEARRARRAAQFAGYFRQAASQEVAWRSVAILPSLILDRHRLLALEDADGGMLGLGIILDSDRRLGEMTIYTPLRSLERVDSLYVGDLVLDPSTFEDEPLAAR